MKMKNIKLKIVYIIVGALLGASLSSMYFKVEAITGIYIKHVQNGSSIKSDNLEEHKDIDKKFDDDFSHTDIIEGQEENEESNNSNSKVDIEEETKEETKEEIKEENSTIIEDEKDNGSTGTSSTEEQEEQKTSDKLNDIYIVQSGDTLTKISTQFNITVQQLKYINALTSDAIYVGQTLNVVNNSKESSNPEDTLVLVNKKYYLPSYYVPSNLVVPNVPFPFQEFHTKKLMRSDAALALEELFNKAKEDNIDLYAISGYRSYETQKSIFNSNVNRYGIERANKFSAKPGESEHQTGLAMDITSPLVKYGLTQYFGKTKEGKWLQENANNFGFIIRYPQGKENITGYQYEPWHIRYVGKEAAEEISNHDITLEEYLGKI